MCTKWWYIGYTGIACVEVTGHISRPLAGTATSTVPADLCDFTIDYVKHNVKIQIGQYDEADTAKVRFSETDVDFNLFFPQEGKAVGLTSSIALALAGIVSTFF
jgi:hypothetical protein